jgi:formate dehydrogenase subunit delta
MKTDNMVHMANQIALFFAGYPHDEAVAGVTKHFKDFWERRMKDRSSNTSPRGAGACMSWRWKR